MKSVPMSPVAFYKEAYAAVTDFGFYRSVFDQPIRRTLFYLLYLACHVAIILTLIYAWQYGGEMHDFFSWAQTNFPHLSVENGQLSVPGNKPLTKVFEGRQPVTFVFDTSESHPGPQDIREPGFLLTRDGLYIHYGGQVQTYRWKDYGAFQVDAGQWQHWETLIRWIYFPVSYSFFFLYAMISKGVLAMTLTLFGLSASSRLGVRLPFRDYFTIALYALTPAVLIDLAVTATGLEISYFFMIYLATGAIYTYMATQKCVVVE